MRVAIITESFPPDVNGVANTVLRVAEQLTRRGHQALVIAPQPPRGARQVGPFPYPVVRVPAVPLPGYPSFRLGLPSRRIRAALSRHGTDVVHLASPVCLGAYGAVAATRLGLPMVAVYQTDLPAYARAYRLGRAGEAFAWRWLRRIHNSAGRTLAPSTMTATGLLGHGMRDVWLWGRGVDTERFDPARRSPDIRAELAPGGEIVAGYVGRLATEKRVELLAGVAGLDGVRLVIVGAGPAEASLRPALPGASFLGERRGAELAAIYASMDVFVHSGPYETFGQTLQEAAASGLPVVAPAAGGPLDLVADGATGYLVPPGDEDAITAAVHKLAADPALRASFGAAGRQRVLGRTWSALTDELLSHYSAILGPGPREPKGRGAAWTEERGTSDEGRQRLDAPRRRAAPMKIVRLANFVAPRSGGLRTALRELGAGYLAAGHEPVLIIPGDRDGDEETSQGRVITLRGPRVPMLGGYRVLLGKRRVADLLGELRPDALEVSDRATLRWTGRWARQHGVPAVMVSHESLAALIGMTVPRPGPARVLADALNRATARAYDQVVCTTGWAAAEFERIGARNLTRAPLGVDLDTFRPGLRLAAGLRDEVLLVHCGRLSAEKRPQRSVTTLATLRTQGLAVRMIVAGDGPLRGRLERRAVRDGLPVTFTGFLAGRADVAALLASADVVLAPGPAETFGLAALEALACGTPVVASAESALPEVIGAAGASVAGEDLAAGVRAVLARPEEARRASARARAEEFGWDAAVREFLGVHGAGVLERSYGRRSTP
jgi:phosphatidylinositol alpha 1,6-mannosyltransferase